MIRKPLLSRIYEPTQEELPRLDFNSLKNRILPDYAFRYEDNRYSALSLILLIEKLQEGQMNPSEICKNIKCEMDHALIPLNELHIVKKKKKLNF